MKKTKLYLNEAERKYVIYALNELRNKLLSEGRYTDTVNETLIKVANAKTRKVKVS